MTEPLQRCLRQIGISSSIRSRRTLCEHLVHPKDKLEKLDINGVIYYHACASINNSACEADYVGESSRAASTRNAEHFSTSQSAPGIYKLAIMQHAADAQHHFRSEDVKILSRESGWHERGIRESIFIRALSPSLNRNEGRHILPHCYDPLIRKAIKRPERPKTHAPTELRLNTEKRGPGRPRAISSTAPEDTTPKSLPQSTHPMTTRSRGTAANRDGPSPVQSD